MIWILVGMAIALWAWSGLKKMPVGWRGLLLFLGNRQEKEFKEGWRWAPFPFGIKATDCRQLVIKLDPVEAITKDNVMVTIEGSIVRAISNLYAYFGVEETGLKQGLDDIWDEIIRAEVRKLDLDKVLGMQGDIAHNAHVALRNHANVHWGINVLRVVVASIKPVDEKVDEDLALLKREELQRQGQALELKHFAEQVTALMKEAPDGPGLTREQAIEQVQLALGQLKKETRAQAFSFDPATAAMVAAILGGKKS